MERARHTEMYIRHPERSEGSRRYVSEILRSAQDDSDGGVF
jgi:hypothetical protein